MKPIALVMMALGAWQAAAQVRVLDRPVTQADLAGEWYKSSMSTVDYVNRSTGAHSAPSGERLNIKFSPDGGYKLGFLLQSSLYGCSTTIFGYQVGSYTFADSIVNIDVKTNTMTSKDTCHAEWNYQKQVPVSKSVYQVRLGQSEYGPVLILRSPNGKDEVYARQTGKSLLGD